MAEVLQFKIQFLAANPLGEFVSGDVIDIYYDPTTDPTPSTGSSVGYSVKKNGVTILTGSDIQTGEQSYKTETFSNFGVCNTTTLIIAARNTMSFPYATSFLLPNYPSCSITPVTCDLMFVGEPLVVAASGESVSDGSITVSATSSQSIEFNLNSDFIYGDGDASGVFTGLLPGSYRIYARDENNCGTNILVTVGVDNTYGVLHVLEYYVTVGSEQVSQTKIEIQQRAYSGSSSEYCAGPSPIEISLRGEGELNKFMPVMSMNATLTLIAETNFQYVHLFSSDRNKYRVVYSKDFGSGYETMLTLNIVPQTYQEPYLFQPYELSIITHDGLADLKDLIYSQPDGLPYSGSVKVIKLISDCLKKTGIQLNIRVGCNIYAEGMDTADTDDPMDQAYVDVSRFYLFNQAPTVLFVLSSLVEAFDARLVQWENRWNITRVEELQSSYDWREFDSNGDYVTDGNTDPIVDRVEPLLNGVWFRDQDQNLEIINGYGKARIKYDLGRVNNIIRNGDFTLKSVYNSLFDLYSIKINTDGFTIVNTSYSLQESYEQIDNENVALIITGDEDTDGTAYIVSSSYNLKMGAANTIAIKIRYKIPAPIISLPYVKLRVLVQYGDYYLASSGAWTTEINRITFYVTEFDKYVESEIIAVQPDGGAVAGYAFGIIVSHAWCYHFEYEGVTALKARVTTALPQGIRTEIHVNAGTFYTGESIIYYELEENTDAEAQPNIVRPDDYHASTNPVQWIMKKRVFPETLIVLSSSPLQVLNVSRTMFIDKIEVGYLYNGAEVMDVITLDKAGQVNNNEIFERTVYLGSLVETAVSNPVFGLKIGLFETTTTATFNLVSQSILGSNLIYAGYFRDVDGVGYRLWTRDGFSEAKELHQIQLSSMAGQYGSSVKRLTGSFISTQFIGPLHTINEVLDDNTLYIPMGMTINDQQNSFSGEFIELKEASSAAESPFSSAFTFGFGDGGFD